MNGPTPERVGIGILLLIAAVINFGIPLLSWLHRDDPDSFQFEDATGHDTDIGRCICLSIRPACEQLPCQSDAIKRILVDLADRNNGLLICNFPHNACDEMILFEYSPSALSEQVSMEIPANTPTPTPTWWMTPMAKTILARTPQ